MTYQALPHPLTKPQSSFKSCHQHLPAPKPPAAMLHGCCHRGGLQELLANPLLLLSPLALAVCSRCLLHPHLRWLWAYDEHLVRTSMEAVRGFSWLASSPALSRAPLCETPISFPAFPIPDVCQGLSWTRTCCCLGQREEMPTGRCLCQQVGSCLSSHNQQRLLVLLLSPGAAKP